MKGETSGHTQIIKDMYIDCDNDTLLIKVIQNGKAACHEGYKSCFFRKIEGDRVIIDGKRIFNPEDVYKSDTK
jgi:phosphoribosyl-AMP cyclohydrolase